MTLQKKKVAYDMCENCSKKNTCNTIQMIKDKKAIALYPKDAFRIIISCKDKIL